METTTRTKRTRKCNDKLGSDDRDLYDDDDDYGFYDLRHKDGHLEGLGLQFGGWSRVFCEWWQTCVPNCWMATALPCVAQAQVAARINSTSYRWALASSVVLWVLLLTMIALFVEAMVSSYPSITLWCYAFTDLGYGIVSREIIFFIVAVVLRVVFAVKSMRLRAKVRQLFQIPGNLCMDFCLSCWCSPCTIAQIASHVQSYEPGRCDFGAPDSLPAYC